MLPTIPGGIGLVLARLAALLDEAVVFVWVASAVESDISTASIQGLRVKMCVWLGVSRGLDLAFLNAD